MRQKSYIYYFFLVLLHLHVLNIGFLSHFSFLKTLFPSFLHHLCIQFLYPTNILVSESFSLLVSSNNTTFHCLATFFKFKHLPNESISHQPTSVELFIECVGNVYEIFSARAGLGDEFLE